MKKPDIALQTWSIRHELRRDVKSVLKEVWKIGFRNLEVAGTGRNTPQEFKQYCEKCGLNIIGNHEPSLVSTNTDEIINEIKLRCNVFESKNVTVMFDPDDQGDKSAYLKYAKLCRIVGTELDKIGVTLNYHCYNFDLKPLINLESGLDILIENTRPEELSFELDTYFIFKAWPTHEIVLKKCGRRCSLVHLCDITKDGNRIALGKGIIPWKMLLRDFKKYCSIKCFIIENDVVKPFDAAKHSLSYLNQLLRTY